MFDWLTKKMQGGRYLMNLTLLETDFSGSSNIHRARVIVTAFDFVDSMRQNDPMSGILFERAVTSTLGMPTKTAQQLYNMLEDQLTVGEQQKRQMVKQLGSGGSEDLVKELGDRVAVQEQALRLLMVTLTRQADAEFKTKTRKLKALMSEAKESIDTAVDAMKQEQSITSAVNREAREPDFDGIRQSASVFVSVASLTW